MPGNLILLTAGLGSFLVSGLTMAGVQEYKNGNRCLWVEQVAGEQPYFEYATGDRCKSVPASLYHSPMLLAKEDRKAGSNGQTLDWSDRVEMTVQPATLCIEFKDKAPSSEKDGTPHQQLQQIVEVCPEIVGGKSRALLVNPVQVDAAYGLGQQFVQAGNQEGDWLSHGERRSGAYGNVMENFDEGLTGNTQFPILYALRSQKTSFAMFFDDVHKQHWNFRGGSWRVQTTSDFLRFTLLFDSSLMKLRQQYMSLVGNPLVPPRKAFGLWVSEYGYDDWGELDETLASLRDNGFPLDGFVLDLQWFGGIISGSDRSPMGNLTWDTRNFPDPAAKIAELDKDHVSLISIEESYISAGLDEHDDLEELGYLALKPNGEPVRLDGNPWWGIGGYIDWTQPQAGEYWFQEKRLSLIQDGIVGHWTDLGEPEDYDPSALYAGIPELGLTDHASVHNLYNFYWLESIAAGYERNELVQRPFMMSRSGAPGIQRFGASMWSGDIGSRLSSLAAHNNAQMHMSFSGMDYFGSDIGGFHRRASVESIDEMYTRWFANSVWTDVPVRPHTENLCNCKETSPDKIGSLNSNLENARDRYRLIPYYYSLAHQAYQEGTPLVGPAVIHDEQDPNLWQQASLKMIGRDVLVKTVTDSGLTETDVYLPKGLWMNYRTRDWIESDGKNLKNIPLYEEGIFRLPVFVRAGAILPVMAVTEKTDAFGPRDRSFNEFEVEIYGSENPSRFEVIEDDGKTIAYQKNKVETITVSQKMKSDKIALIELSKTSSGESQVIGKKVIVSYAKKDMEGTAVMLNNRVLTRVPESSTLQGIEEGWQQTDSGEIKIVSTKAAGLETVTIEINLVDKPTKDVFGFFVCENIATSLGEEVKVIGNIPELGNWNVEQGISMTYTAHNKWVEVVKNLPPATEFEWKCVLSRSGSILRWEPGYNNRTALDSDGYQGVFVGRF